MQLHVHKKGLHRTNHDTTAACRQLKSGSKLYAHFYYLQWPSRVLPLSRLCSNRNIRSLVFICTSLNVQHSEWTFCVIYFYAHTGKWQNNQQFDGGHSADEVEVEDSLVSTEIIGYKNRVIIWINSSYWVINCEIGINIYMFNHEFIVDNTFSDFEDK
jgi:hypothetical protein